ncbi:hypothetical protein [Streptomyces sp. NPDC002537]
MIDGYRESSESWADLPASNAATSSNALRGWSHEDCRTAFTAEAITMALADLLEKGLTG